MANDFYTASGVPATSSQGSSAAMRAELAAVMAGFDKMPALAASAYKTIRVNSSNTGLEGYDPWPTNGIATATVGLASGSASGAHLRLGKYASMMSFADLSGTSNSTQFYIDVAYPSTSGPSVQQSFLFIATDNGVKSIGVAIIGLVSNRIVLYPTTALGAWTSSGTKAFSGLNIVYRTPAWNT